MLWAPRYQNFYDVIRSNLPRVPIQRVAAGTHVLRSVAAEYKGIPADQVSARTIRKGSLADHRWTGSRGHGTPGRGALYVSMHLDSMSNELLHYSKAPVSIFTGERNMTYALRDTATFCYALKHPLTLVDLSLESPEGREFLEQLGAKREVDRALLDAGYKSFTQAYQSDDYSFCRAIGHVVIDEYGSLIDGLRVATARDEYPKLGETSENLALFGEDNAAMTNLSPVSKTNYATDAAGKLTQTVTHYGPRSAALPPLPPTP